MVRSLYYLYCRSCTHKYCSWILGPSRNFRTVFCKQVYEEQYTKMSKNSDINMDEVSFIVDHSKCYC